MTIPQPTVPIETKNSGKAVGEETLAPLERSRGVIPTATTRAFGDEDPSVRGIFGMSC